MTYAQARRWLGLYFLIFSALLAAYLLIFPPSLLLPISESDGNDALQIVLPVFLGQVVVMFQWISQAERASDRRRCPIPTWAIVVPPILAALLVVGAAVAMAVGNQSDGNAGVSPSAFKGVLTAAVAILNASTVFLVARLFPSSAAPSTG